MSHVDVALPFVESGAAVLVEKPLAAHLADADRLLAAADARGTVLAAGHTERFNPAVAAALPLVSQPAVRRDSPARARFPSAASTSTSSSI